MERKMEIVFNIEENSEHLQRLTDHKWSYKQVHKKQGLVRYYSAGVAIQKTESFKRQTKCMTEFISPYILSLSIDSRVEPNDQYTFKHYRRVFIPFGTEVQTIRLDGLSYKNFPQAVDFDLVDIKQCDVDLNLKQVRILATVPIDFSLEESEYDKFRYYQEKIEPLYSHARKVMVRTGIDLYGNELIANEVFKIATTLFSSMDLMNSTESNRNIRERLIRVLIGTDVPTLSPDNSHVLLKEPPEGCSQNAPTFATGGYEYRGAIFADRIELENALRHAEFFGQTEDEMIANKKRDNRYEYMFSYLNHDQRLLQITEDEINDVEFVTFAMTDDERSIYEPLLNSTDENEIATRLEIARVAKLRWKVANGRV